MLTLAIKGQTARSKDFNNQRWKYFSRRIQAGNTKPLCTEMKIKLSM